MFGDQATNSEIYSIRLDRFFSNFFLQWALLLGHRISKNHQKITIFDIQIRGWAIISAWAIIKINMVILFCLF